MRGLLWSCAMAVCLAGCGQGRTGPAPAPDTAALSPDLQALAAKLEAAGFVKTEDDGPPRIYTKDAVAYAQLKDLLGAGLEMNLRPVANGPPDEAILFGNLSENLWCLLKFKVTLSRHPLDTDVVAASVLLGAPPKIGPTILSAGQPKRVVAQALRTWFARDISATASTAAAAPAKPGAAPDVLRTYVLADGTWLEIVYDGGNKDLPLKGMKLGVKGKDYSDRKLDRAAEMKPITTLDLTNYLPGTYEVSGVPCRDVILNEVASATA